MNNLTRKDGKIRKCRDMTSVFILTEHELEGVSHRNLASPIIVKKFRKDDTEMFNGS